MVRWSGFYLSFVLAVIFAAIGVYYLIPGVYHPFSSDTIDVTHAHLTDAAVFLVLAVLAIVAGRFSRPSAK
jgi:H+/Cl- antiporter ClcA